MKIKVLEKTPGCMPAVFDVGDWYDLCTAEDIKLKAPAANKLHTWNKSKEDVPTVKVRDVDFDFKLIPLGVAMQYPSGYEVVVVPRNSTFKKYGLLQTNSMGIIDSSHASDKDEWKVPVIATKAVTIPKGTRIAQFRIQPSQKATRWQKIKWLFSNGAKLKKVSFLKSPERGGFGKGTDNK